MFEASCEVAVKLADTGRQKARRGDVCEVGLAQFLSLFQDELTMGME